MVLRPENSTKMDAETPRSNKPQEQWSGIIGTGQSLSVGFQAWLSKPTPSAPFAMKLHDEKNEYDMAAPDARSLSIAPLTEPFRPCTTMPDTYPGNINGKSPQHSMALQVALLCEAAGRPGWTTVHSCVGKNGAPLWEIEKDGTRNSYEASIYEVQALLRLAKEHGASLKYDAIVLTHGEADAMLGHETYAEDIMKFRNDYVSDLASLGGEGDKQLVLIHSQQQSLPFLPDVQPQLIHDQWFVQKMSNGKVLCACPKYQYAYAPGGVHLPLGGYDRLGEKYGQVYFETVICGREWRPLAPRGLIYRPSIGPYGAIQVLMDVAHPPLQWDAVLPRMHENRHTGWTNGRGFEVRDNAGKEVPIVGAAINDDIEVHVILAEKVDKSRMPMQLSYAMSQEADGYGACGNSDGRMGHLCDSDPTKSASEATKTVIVQKGSATVLTAPGEPEWTARQTAYDDVIDVATGEAYVLVGMFEEGKLPTKAKRAAVLDRKWQGESGRVSLRCSHNLRNYCVSFHLPVAYPFTEDEEDFCEEEELLKKVTKEVADAWRGYNMNEYESYVKKLRLGSV